MKRKLAILVGLALVVASSAFAGNQDIHKYVLFPGANTDSTEQASRWIPVRGASRVIIRLWTTKSAFGNGTEADSLFSDSLQAIRVLVSDSLSFQASDSLGSIVTWRNTTPRLDAIHSEPFPMCADSVLVPVTVAGDTSGTSFMGTGSVPINKTLRAPATGSGEYMVIFPSQPGPGTGGQIDQNGAITKNYLRVRCTPLRRMTANTAGATGCSGACGTRVNGLKGFKMEAFVVFSNK